MEKFKLNSFAELSTDEMYAIDGGWICPLGPVVPVPFILWWIRKK